MKFNIKKWQNKQLNEASLHVRGLNDLKDNYYTISDELYDMQINIKNVLGTMEGEEWAKNKILIWQRNQNCSSR